MKLNQIIAVEKGIRSRAHYTMSEQCKLIQQPAIFGGNVRTYQKADDAGEDLPAERKHVQFRVQMVMHEVRTAMADLINVTLRKDETNSEATADIKIDGTAIATDIPVTTLLFLEKQLTDLRTFIANIPVLDPAEVWLKDNESGLYRTQPKQTRSTRKLQRPIVLYDATAQHPAQTQLVTEDVLVGHWNTVLHSGAIPAPEKEELTKRAERLIIAVKEAREEANSTEAKPRRELGEVIFDYLYSKTGGQ